MTRRIISAAVALLLGAGLAFAQSPDWAGAEWISLEQDRPFDYPKYFHSAFSADNSKWKGVGMYKLPIFRKEFNAPDGISEAKLYICGLGQFELFLNGEKVGDHFLDPGWTDFNKEVVYVEFDVTSLLKDRNAIGVMLGNGFYNIPDERYRKIVGSMGAPKMRMVLEMKRTDGKLARIVSDTSWKVCAGPITYSSIYGGESFDANLDPKGWKKPGFDDSAWNKPVSAGFNPLMLPQENEPLRVKCELDPVKVAANGYGWLYDMGQNFSGIFRITVRGRKGQTVKIVPAELAPDGIADQKSSGGPCWYDYTFASDGEITWQPQFTYYGQRYFQIEGAVPEGTANASGLPVVKKLTGLHTSAAVKPTGTFRCSNELFNRIDDLVNWALSNNTASVLTDCPHREKLGWTEEVQLMFKADEYRFNLLDTYKHEMRQMMTAQRPDGCIPTIAPEYVRFENWFEDSPEWGCVIAMLPWYIYRWYGVDTYLPEYYPAMKKYIAYLNKMKDSRGLVAYGLGDWLSTNKIAADYVTSHLTYIHTLKIMVSIAGHLGLAEDVAAYTSELDEAVKTFNKVAWDPEKQVYDNNNQAVNAMALALDVVPEGRRDRIYNYIVEDMKAHDYAVQVGEVAHPYLLDVLHRHGDDELIFKMHTQRTKPGYAYVIDHGATALPEAWDGGLSQTHICLGHIGSWFYEGLAGICMEPQTIGWDDFRIEPRPVGDVKWVDCDFESPRGLISSHWRIDDSGVFNLRVTVPDDSKALIVLPDGTMFKKPAGTYIFSCRM